MPEDKPNDLIAAARRAAPYHPLLANQRRDGKRSTIAGFEPSDEMKLFLKKYRTGFSTGGASFISTFVAFPLDFAKSRMQSFPGRFVPIMREAYRYEGVRTFWRGVIPPMLSITFVRIWSFTIYQKAKYTYSGGFERVFGEAPLDVANAIGRYPNLLTMSCFALAGATSGSIVSAIACPFELTKLHAQIAGKMDRMANESLTNPVKYSAYRTAKQLIREHGINGLYCGYRLHFIRDTLGTAIFFTTYESAKQIFGNARGQSPTNPWAVMAGGGLCGIVSWTCTYPIDVAKTLYQKALLTQPRSEVQMPRINFFRATSFRGLGVSVGRSAVINMIFFTYFEKFKKGINGLDTED